MPNRFKSQILYDLSLTASYALCVYSSIVSKRNSVQVICQYASGCKVDSDCVSGNKCNTEKLPYYSQCVPDPSKYSTNPTCLQNWGERCSSTSDCCDPGSYCNSNWWYRQCQQPQLHSSACLSLPSAVPTRVLTATPSFRPSQPFSAKIPICQYGGYCRSNSDCALGNKCVIQSAYYSQCLPDPSQYATTNCAPTYNTKCSVSSDCCDPGTICTQIGGCPYSTCVPMQSPMCTNPIGYAPEVPSNVPVAIPSVSPTVKATTDLPTIAPTSNPTIAPTSNPTIALTFIPTATLTDIPTAFPTAYYPCRNTTSCGARSAILALPSKPNEKVIYNAAFRSCPAVSVVIDLSVISIGEAAFLSCTSLASIMVPTTVTAIGSNCFQGCTSLKTIELPSSLTSLPDLLFAYGGLVSIVIPTTVTMVRPSDTTTTTTTSFSHHKINT